MASKPEPSAFDKALSGWRDTNLRICHLEKQKYFVSGEDQEVTCRGRGGYVAYATAEERAKVQSTDMGVPLEREAIGEHKVIKRRPPPEQRSFDPLAN